MERKTITEVIFSKTYDSDIADVKFGDLPKDLQDEDIIDIQTDEFMNTTKLSILRERLENDEEFNKRYVEHEKSKLFHLKIKYENYLKLKNELEQNGYKL